MKITWLGQAGLLFESEKCTILIDPYLSDSVAKVQPKNYRRVPVDPSFFEKRPDVLIFTHDHLDHFDPETAPKFLERFEGITVLAPTSAWNKARAVGGNHNFVEFNRHTEWTEYGIRFTAVKAAHSDPYAIGVLIEDGTKTYYVTGDTLYNTEIFADLPEHIDVVFLPVNGVGNNMNETDAGRFVKRIGAVKAVPIHVGMFDEKSPADCNIENKVVPEIYKEIKLED